MLRPKLLTPNSFCVKKKVLNLLENIGQYTKDAEWYQIGLDYDVEVNKDKYTNKKAVEEFLMYYRSGFLPKHKTFSVFYDRMRDEAIALFNLFNYAENFEIFYKTAAYARVHFNDGQFLYAYYAAVFQREDTNGLVLPAPYEMYPQYFVNTDAFLKAYRVKMQQGIVNPAGALESGIVHENDYYVFYANYSTSYFTGNEEQKLAYFTEDIGMNSYYNTFQTIFPFWLKGGKYEAIKEFRGEAHYYTYQQLIARYYLERLSNGMGEIPEFSWNKPIETGYTCLLSTYYPFVQRNDHYQINKEENSDYIQFLNNYEQSFLHYLEQGHFKAYNQEIDLHNSKAINWVGNYWFTNVDLYEKAGPRNYQRFYEIIGRHVLAGTPEPVDKYSVIPSALELYQTSLRDPVFYQFYKRILNYIIQWKEYLEPYNHKQLSFEGVKINEVTVDKLVTYFDFFDFDITNDVFQTVEEIKGDTTAFKVRQPRLAHKPFTVTVDIKSDVATDAVLKFFLGPKYDSNGYPLSIEDNWMNFIELDWFTHKLTTGQNKIERKSEDFFFYKEDSVPVTEVLRMLDQGKVPLDMSENFDSLPNRMMLPKGTKGGFPFQLYVVVFPTTALPTEYEAFSEHFPDGKPIGYPLDRPVYETYFKQPNIYHEDVFIYHEGEKYANQYNVPGFTSKNEVPKH